VKYDILVIGGGNAALCAALMARRQGSGHAYCRSEEQLGVEIRYETSVSSLELDGSRFVAAHAGNQRFEAKSCVLVAGGFESNIEWLTYPCAYASSAIARSDRLRLTMPLSSGGFHFSSSPLR
jgi:thioredoxin reductase